MIRRRTTRGYTATPDSYTTEAGPSSPRTPRAPRTTENESPSEESAAPRARRATPTRDEGDRTALPRFDLSDGRTGRAFSRRAPVGPLDATSSGWRTYDGGLGGNEIPN